MKLFRRSNTYKASNVSFNPETCTAYSYDWWCFVRTIKGKVIFNDYFYSQSTSKHQRKVKNLLDKLGIKVDRYVQVQGGLQSCIDLTSLNRAEKETKQHLTEVAERARIRRNERARARRLEVKAEREAALQTAKELNNVVQLRGVN